MQEQQQINQDNQLLCQKHGRLSFDICLHHSPRKDRLLCRLCKQDLPQEELVEVTSLTDFFSCNFLNGSRDMVEQELKRSRQKMNQENSEGTLKTFFSNIEQGLIKTLDEVKKKFFEKYSLNSKRVDKGNRIKKTIEGLAAEIETLKTDPQKKFSETVCLNRISQKYASVLSESAKYAEEESTNQTDSPQALDKFKLNSDSYKNFKEDFLGKISNLLKGYDEDNSSELSSDGFVDPSLVTIKVIQQEEEDDENGKKCLGGEEAYVVQDLSSSKLSGIYVEKMQKLNSNKSGESQEKKATKCSEDSGGGLEMMNSESNMTSKTSFASKSARIPQSIRKRKDICGNDYSDNAVKENTTAGPRPLLKRIKKIAAATLSPRPQNNNQLPIEEETLFEDNLNNSPKTKTESSSIVSKGEVSLQPIDTLKGKHDYILWGGLCYVPDKKHIVVGDQGGNLCVWNVETRELLFHKYLAAAKIYKVIYLSNQKVVLASREDGEINIFDVRKSYSMIVCFRKHSRQVFSMVYIKSLDSVASSGEDGNIALWSYSQKDYKISSTRKLMTDDMQVSSLCYIEDKDLLVAATYKEGYLMVFNPKANQCITRIKAHNKIKSIDCLCYIPVWQQVVSGSEDSSIKFWDFSNFARDAEEEPTLNCVKTLRRSASYVESVVVIPEANCLINTNVDPKLSVWNLATDKIAYEVMGSAEGESGEAMIYLEDRRELVAAFGNQIRLWKVKF